MRARLGCMHDKGASATEVFYSVRDFFVVTDMDSDEKKKTPGDLGHHISFIPSFLVASFGIEIFQEGISILQI